MRFILRKRLSNISLCVPKRTLFHFNASAWADKYKRNHSDEYLSHETIAREVLYPNWNAPTRFRIYLKQSEMAGYI